MKRTEHDGDPSSKVFLHLETDQMGDRLGEPMISHTGFQGSTFAITGGTGSFGTVMAKHLLSAGVRAVHILSRDETKQDEMRRRFGDERLRFFLGDVRDVQSLRPAMEGVDYVFHAAALKQVPSCEFFPQQAVKTNVIGSENVLNAAHEAGVRSLVCLSTDKAVYPVNAMGMSKALMEKTVQAFARNHPGSTMRVALTRYGNVMYSRGSVIPLFVEQLRRGDPLTVTEPSMTRYLMSLPDSVDLVMHAFAHAQSGDLFVQKAPASDISTLARAVAVIHGRDDAAVRTIGIRHGEKMHETLLSMEEMARAVDQGDYFRVPLDVRSLQYEKFFSEGDAEIARDRDYTSENTRRLDLAETIELLLALPEFLHLDETAKVS